jgi:hypothetical protein
LKAATLPVPASLDACASPIIGIKKNEESVRINPVFKNDKRWKIMEFSLGINDLK